MNIVNWGFSVHYGSILAKNTQYYYKYLSFLVHIVIRTVFLSKNKSKHPQNIFLCRALHYTVVLKAVSSSFQFKILDNKLLKPSFTHKQTYLRTIGPFFFVAPTLQTCTYHNKARKRKENNNVAVQRRWVGAGCAYISLYILRIYK